MAARRERPVEGGAAPGLAPSTSHTTAARPASVVAASGEALEVAPQVRVEQEAGAAAG